MEIILAEPQGFCAGVERAIKVVDEALVFYPDKKIYVFHEIVHNKYILSDFRQKGVQFTENLSEVPDDAVLIFSAHGVAKTVIHHAQQRISIVIDATCPLVTKVHKEGQRHENNGLEVILIGHKGHHEVIGTMGQMSTQVSLVQSVKDIDKLTVKDPTKLAYITQTTLSIDDTAEIISKLKERFPEIKGQNTRDICYATQNRQNAVKKLVKFVDLILVVGSQNSSNSMRLKEIGLSYNIPSYLIDDKEDIDSSWFNEQITKVGITAGASAPNTLVQGIVSFLQTKLKIKTLNTLSIKKEHTTFKLPKLQAEK